MGIAGVNSMTKIVKTHGFLEGDRRDGLLEYPPSHPPTHLTVPTEGPGNMGGWYDRRRQGGGRRTDAAPALKPERDKVSSPNN